MEIFLYRVTYPALCGLVFGDVDPFPLSPTFLSTLPSPSSKLFWEIVMPKGTASLFTLGYCGMPWGGGVTSTTKFVHQKRWRLNALAPTCTQISPNRKSVESQKSQKSQLKRSLLGSPPVPRPLWCRHILPRHCPLVLRRLRRSAARDFFEVVAPDPPSSEIDEDGIRGQYPPRRVFCFLFPYRAPEKIGTPQKRVTPTPRGEWVGATASKGKRPLPPAHRPGTTGLHPEQPRPSAPPVCWGDDRDRIPLVNRVQGGAWMPRGMQPIRCDSEVGF